MAGEATQDSLGAPSVRPSSRPPATGGDPCAGERVATAQRRRAAASRQPTPDDLAGIWRRDALVRPDGSTDGTTQVYWFQARTLFADIRLPAGDPLSVLEGFAGWTALCEERGALRCRWERRLDWRPSDVDDVGRLTWIEGGARLREDGVEAPYHEVWRKVGAPRSGDGAWRLCADTGVSAAAEAVILRIDARFLAVAAIDGRALDICLGRVEASGWRVDQSLSSVRDGVLLNADASPTEGVASALDGFALDDAHGEPLRWRIVESETF